MLWHHLFIYVLLLCRLLPYGATVTFRFHPLHFHFECYWFDYSPTKCRYKQQLRTYFEFFSNNNFHDTAAMIRVHLMICFLPMIWMFVILLLILILILILIRSASIASVDTDASFDPLIQYHLCLTSFFIHHTI